MDNSNRYWKDAYADYWEETSEKERQFAKLIFDETGIQLEPYGLGAESDEFVEGSAQDNGLEKGAPDYRIMNTNIYLEVTGPNSKHVTEKGGLWLRPDKLRYAFDHRKTDEEWFALLFVYNQKWLVIRADQEFFAHVKAHWNTDLYRRITPIIRGRQEIYISISPESPYVRPLEDLIRRLKEGIIHHE